MCVLRPLTGEIRLGLTSRHFNQLQQLIAGARAGSSTVRVDIAQLQQLIADHQLALEACQKRGVTIIEERG